MEMILAFAITLLAIILGFLTTKRLTVARVVVKLIDLFALKWKKAGYMENTKRAEEQLKSKRVPLTKQGRKNKSKDEGDQLSDEMGQSGGFTVNSENAHMLSPTDSDGNPLKVKDFIRMLRENQQSDMTEEEIEEEKRIQKQQLEEIFQLMQSSQNQYGIDSIDDMEEQMKMYAVGE